MNFENLTEDNFLLFAAHYYENPQCTDIEEFYEDMRRIKYIRKLLTRYEETGDLKERLILNHIIILNNMFGPKALVRILFLKFKNQLHLIKPFLLLLNILPDIVYGVNGNMVHTDSISMDSKIIKKLREI